MPAGSVSQNGLGAVPDCAEGGEHVRVLLAAVPMTLMRGSIVTVAAQRVVAENLLLGQQRPLSDVSFQVNGPEIALQDCYRI